MSDPAPPARRPTILPGAELDNDSLFWQWVILGAAALFFLEFLWFLAVWNMLGFDRVAAAVAVTAGSTLVPPLALAPARHRRWAHILVVAGSAMSLPWLLMLLVAAGMVGDR